MSMGWWIILVAASWLALNILVLALFWNAGRVRKKRWTNPRPVDHEPAVSELRRGGGL